MMNATTKLTPSHRLSYPSHLPFHHLSYPSHLLYSFWCESVVRREYIYMRIQDKKWKQNRTKQNKTKRRVIILEVRAKFKQQQTTTNGVLRSLWVVLGCWSQSRRFVSSNEALIKNCKRSRGEKLDHKISSWVLYLSTRITTTAASYSPSSHAHATFIHTATH